MWAWYKKGGFEKVAAWLWQRDVSRFNPAAAPPVTEWKLNMVEHGLSVAESYLVDMLRARTGVFAQGVVAGPFHKICDTIASSLPAGTKVPQGALLHAFKEAGWIDCGRIGSVDFQTKRHIFAAGDVLARYKKSELRRMVEYVAPPEGGVVKL